MGFAILAMIALPASPGLGQEDNRSTMVMSDGQQHRVVHFARPDLGRALRPWFVPSDAAVLARELVLTDDQREMAFVFIMEYQDAFEALKREQYEDLVRQAGPDGAEKIGASAGPRERNRQPRRDSGGPPPGPTVNDSEARDAMRGIMLEELRRAGFDINSMDDFPYPPEVSIGISVSQTDDGATPQPVFDVNVSFASGDDSLAGEVRDKLQAAADRIVPRLTEQAKQQFEERSAARAGASADDPGGALESAWNENERLRSRVSDMAAASARLRAEVEEELKSLLDETQLAQWPRFERVLTRLKTLPWGAIAEERTDLIAVVDSMDLDVESLAAISNALAEYETQLHNALTHRNMLLQTTDSAIDHALHEGETRRAVSLAKRLTAARTAICDLNNAFMQRLAAEMPQQSGEEFQSRALEASFPRVYRRTVGAAAFEAVDELDSLDRVQQETIAGLRAAYEADIHSVNQRLRDQIRRAQSDRLVSEIERVAALIETGSPGPDDRRLDDGVAEAFEQRVELDRRYMRLLYSQLTAAERAGLPRVPGDDALDPVESGVRDTGRGAEDD